MEQVSDFLSESEVLSDVLDALPEGAWARPTGFKGWTVSEILRHLYVWNRAVDRAACDPDAFRAWIGAVFDRMGADGLRPIEAVLPGHAVRKPAALVWPRTPDHRSSLTLRRVARFD